MYISITQIDADTGIICTQEPMRTGPSYPQIKGFIAGWDNSSTWPIPTTPTGACAVAPLFFGTCDDDADITVPGVIATYTAEEYTSMKRAEFYARRHPASWTFNDDNLTWEPPTPYPTDGKRYRWEESTISWVENTIAKR